MSREKSRASLSDDVECSGGARANLKGCLCLFGCEGL
jgi:hypothetical protein